MLRTLIFVGRAARLNVYAKRFNFDVHAIGGDIRRSETESGGKFAVTIPRRKIPNETRRAKTVRRKPQVKKRGAGGRK